MKIKDWPLFPQLFLAYTLGIMLDLLYVTAPIHELGHVIYAQFHGLGTSMGWRDTLIYGHMSSSVNYGLMWSGVAMETYLPSVTAVILSVFTKKKTWIQFVLIGSSISAYSAAGRLTDIKSIHYRGLTEWNTIGAVILSIFMLFLIVMAYVKRARYSTQTV